MQLSRLSNFVQHFRTLGKIIVVLVVVAAAYGYTLEELADVDFNEMECDKDGEKFLLLPSFTNCSQFYMCAFGEEIPFECAPGGLIFDFREQTCNWPSEVKCVTRTEKLVAPEGSGDGSEDNFEVLLEDDSHAEIQSFEDEDDSSVAAPKHFNSVLNCDQSDLAAKQVAYKGDCQRFWKCVNGLPQTMYCSDGLFFNEQSQQCDYEANVKCSVVVEEELQGEFIVYK